MSDLREKAIKIKGKDYVQVKDRVLDFNQSYENGSIKTEIIATNGKVVRVKAIIIPDIKIPDRFFTGHAEETYGDGLINKTSALENCETSAVGRALAMMGIGVIDGFASADEVKGAIEKQKAPEPQGEYDSQDFIFKYGPHKSKSITEVPDAYLHSLAGNDNRVAAYAQAEMARRMKEKSDEV